MVPKTDFWSSQIPIVGPPVFQICRVLNAIWDEDLLWSPSGPGYLQIQNMRGILDMDFTEKIAILGRTGSLSEERDLRKGISQPTNVKQVFDIHIQKLQNYLLRLRGHW